MPQTTTPSELQRAILRAMADVGWILRRTPCQTALFDERGVMKRSINTKTLRQLRGAGWLQQVTAHEWVISPAGRTALQDAAQTAPRTAGGGQ